MLISLGILAWNEENIIGDMLRSLFAQTVFHKDTAAELGWDWEIIVVPNGCSDGTAAVAERVLSMCVSSVRGYQLTYAVRSLSEAGKSNAWNHFIHNFSNKDAKFIVLADADIKFKSPQTLHNTISALLMDPEASVAVDLPLKDTLLKERMTWIEKISIAGSQEAIAGPIGICGQFYCGRARVLRQIWMPKGLSGEDGFLRAMIVTNFFRQAAKEEKVIRAEDASHYYKGLTSIKAIFQHELRLVIGTTLNCYLMWDSLLFCTDPKGRGAGLAIKEQLEMDPLWYQKFIYNAVSNRGWWRLPRGMFWRRLRRLRSVEGKWTLSRRKIVTAMVGFALDIPVFICANYKLKRKNIIGYW